MPVRVLAILSKDPKMPAPEEWFGRCIRSKIARVAQQLVGCSHYVMLLLAAIQPEILELFQQEELPLRAAHALTDHLGTRNSQESRRLSETRAAQKRQQPGSHSMGSRSEIGIYFLHELACLNFMHC